MNEIVRVIRTIYLALGAGATLLACVVVYFSIQSFQAGVVPTAQQINSIRILVLVLIVFCSLIYPTSRVMYKKVLFGGPDSLSVEGRIRSAFIVRIAMFEGVAFFGLVISLLSAYYGIFHNYPASILVSTPYFILLGLITTTFPNEESLTQLRESMPAVG